MKFLKLWSVLVIGSTLGRHIGLPLHAQEWNFGIGGGVGIPIGDWSETYNIGFGGEGYGIYSIPPQMGVLPGLGFWYFTGGQTAGPWEWNYTFRRICPFADFRFSFAPGITTGFIQGGVGIYMDEITAEVDGTSSSDSKNRIGIRLGGGMKYYQLELMGTAVIADDTDMVNVRLSFTIK